jgi:RNA-directed DNA polymerase
VGHIHGLYSSITSQENIFTAWREFVTGKKNKKDVLDFSASYEASLIALADALQKKTYCHGGYQAFTVCDPKQRSIHKAVVLDRVLHHAIHRILEPIFEKRFIYDSYSSRKYKGIHAARKRFYNFAWKLSQNNTKTVWVLKCDIRKFFDSVDHQMLTAQLKKQIACPDTLRLLEDVISSYGKEKGVGIPLGNLTSQLFSNVYMDQFDQFVKRELRVKQYLRYADDFTVLSNSRRELEQLIPVFDAYLQTHLKLAMHPQKIQIEKWHRGIDILGAVIYPYHQALRTKTKARVFSNIGRSVRKFKEKKIEFNYLRSVVHSYTGILAHVNARRLVKKVALRIFNKAS